MKISRVPAFFCYCLQAVVVLSIAVIGLRLFSYDLRVPFSYSGDSIVMLTYVKGILLNGWVWSIPQLSAPYQFSAAAFPIATSFDWLLIKALSIFSHEVGLLVNVFWLLTLVFTALSATFSLRLIGADRFISFLCGVLYAFLPFAFFRNVSHLNLVYYLVPLLGGLAVHIASGLTAGKEKQRQLVLLGILACIAQGFNYIYYSFFATIIFAFSALLGYTRIRTFAPVKLAAIAISFLVSAAALNLTPSIYSWAVNGKPPETGYKHVAEAEVYGAKLRKMVAPHPHNRIPLLGTWGTLDQTANFPNENENTASRLGLLTSVGFLFLLFISLNAIKVDQHKHANVLKALASLSLMSFLIITVGGFGALINIFSVPDIRAYNRFSVFIAWFAIGAIAFVTSGKLLPSKLFWKKSWGFLILLFIAFSLSLYDQMLGAKTMVGQQAADTIRYKKDRYLIERLTALAPQGGTVFQLPVTGFPIESVHERMYSYDHLRPFLWAPTNFRWSSPSFSKPHHAWQKQIQQLKGAPLLDALAYSGFDLIWIDRSAYKDGGRLLTAEAIAAGAKPLIIDNHSHIVFLDIKSRNRELLAILGSDEFAARSRAFMSSPFIEVGSGFYHEELNLDGAVFRWSQKTSSLRITNLAAHRRRINLFMEIGSQAPGLVHIESGANKSSIFISDKPVKQEFILDLDSGVSQQISFKSEMAKVDAPQDPRNMFFYITNLYAQ